MNKGGVKTCSTLLAEYLEKPSQVSNPTKLTFQGVGANDVYNITAPFLDEGELVIAGRVEARDSEHSQVVFFVERDGVWVPREGAPTLKLQDPFYTKIGRKLVLGGVQIYPHPEREGMLAWRTVFYQGGSVAELEPFFTGPDGMKDLRLVELADGGIGVFTRPQGKKGGRGKIGFARAASLKDVTLKLIEEAPLFPEQFTDEEWGGVNEAHVLRNGKVGCLGHIACFDAAGDRHYYPMVFAMDPIRGSCSDIELIAVRDRFLPGAAKRSDLRDVVFSGGLIRHADGTADLYAGISDAEAHRITIPDPFLRFES